MIDKRAYFKIIHYLEEDNKKRGQGENGCRKDILSKNTGVEIETIDKLIAEGKIFEEDGRIMNTKTRRNKIQNEDRRKLLSELAYPIKGIPNMESPKKDNDQSKLLEDLENRKKGFSR